MKSEEILRKLEGLHTLDTIVDVLRIKHSSALNLIARLRKEQHLTSSGGGKRKRLYKITMRKQRPRVMGMFDILNKNSQHMQLAPWYDHQVHGRYTVEDAIVDAMLTRSFRVILVSLRSYPKVKNWVYLHRLAKDKGCWQEIGAMHDLARLYFRVKPISRKPGTENLEWKKISRLDDRKNYPEIQSRWCVVIPFNEKDMAEVSG